MATQSGKRTWEIEFLKLDAHKLIAKKREKLDALLSQIKLELYIKKKEEMDCAGNQSIRHHGS